ncbi:hypothetical protein ZN88_15210 [Salmonella enterica subsp. enterica serovar Newport]|nr:hypothetical protein [Salmonella enterica subsp. enterica serovar Newport]
MKNLPAINTAAMTVIFGVKRVVYIVAHYDDKAVYVHETAENTMRCDMAVAANFEPVPVYKPLEYGKSDKTRCNPGEHNYVQIEKSSGPANLDRAFCTRCGNTITLE